MFVDHPLIRRGRIEDRDYQRNIADSCLKRSTLVVLPTGMGKTVIAARVIAHILGSRGGTVLFLAPTKPLVEQHAAFLRDVLVVDADRIAVFTGEVTSPEERELLWRTSKIVASTPQVIRNDVKQGRIDLEGVSLVVFDEAHRAVGNYAYVDVAAAYKENPAGLALGMTASPGSRAETIVEVCGNLGIEGVEIRTEFDPDVVNYVHDIEVEPVLVEPTGAAREIREVLTKVLDEQIERLRTCGFLQGVPRPTTKDLLRAGQGIRGRLDAGERTGALYTAATAQAIAMKVNHAVELAETQGMESLISYLDRTEAEADSRADRQFLNRPEVAKARVLAAGANAEHPKVKKVLWVVREQFLKKPDSRVILFTHYRDTSELMVRELAALPGIKAVRFVGQATRGNDVGLTQREQVEIIERFKAGDHNVLVCTAVGEEGLDIPATDLVVFYEPIPSEIRTIQRRGRTGRGRAGRVVMLVTRDTRDVAYFYSSKKKERKMHVELDRLRRELRQKIFVGQPVGEVFAEVRPAERLERMREAARPQEPSAPAKEPRKPGQAKLPDY
ncbi:MAG: DEAD/DEAH box helicase [Methanobacteriota archaeon]|nr:MAG: DEAD/DEAH box helicase [Euryarchaeota archaeon]